MFIGPDLLLDLEGLLFIYRSDPDGIGAVFQRTILSGDHRPDKASSATDGKWHASVTDLSVGIDFDQRPNQTQQRFMLGMSLPSAQKFTDVDVSHMTADGAFASCRTKTFPEAGSRARNHLSPFGLL